MIKHAIIEGFKNITRSFWLSATAITVLIVSLGSVAIVLTLFVVVGFAVRNLDNLVSIPVFLKSEVTNQAALEAVEKIKRIPDVNDVKYIDKEQAKNELENNQGLAKSFIDSQSKKGENLAWHYIMVTPKTSESYNKVLDELKSPDYTPIVSEVVGYKNFVDNLINFNKYVNVIGIFLIITFMAISILVMVNILRITIYSHREEIEIMRLVGATNNYIRGPFIAEGTYYNIIASSLVVSLFLPSINFLIPSIENYLKVEVSRSGDLLLQMYLMLALTILGGVLVGVSTSYIATQKYLKL